MHLRRLRGEGGFTLITAITGVFLCTLITLGALAAVNGDIHGTASDLDEKRAYEAAQAGIADYTFHLNNDNSYWAKCTNVPAPNAVNQVNATPLIRRAVPGSTGPTYAIELLPATGKSSCLPSDPIGSMIETGGTSIGTFRIRATGYSNNASQRIVASFKRASFLDYVYSTQFETSDPSTYGSTSSIAWANANCNKTRAAGRPTPPTSNPYCDEIVFASGESIDGPLHSNDALAICGTPTFGRTTSDLIESAAPAPGLYAANGCTRNETMKGTPLAPARVLTPPPTNAELKNVPGAVKYTGQVTIVLSGSQYSVNGGAYQAIPASQVIYVSSSSCNAAYNPYTVTYPSSSGCGNVLVRGTYSDQVQLTIGADNDIIINGPLCRVSCSSTSSSGDGLLGLIANNFIRVYHPLTDNATSKTSCNGAGNGSGYLPNLRIDAAMLAINHSFIVDHYNCGDNDALGKLIVNGAISQKYRGAVGLVNSSGYSKDYNYDNRLRYISPPHFLDPVESAWHMQRQTLDP